MKKCRKNLVIALCMLGMFGVWTVLVSFVDVESIGPKCSSVGFATFNGLVHELTGVNMHLYTVTDLLGLVPLCFIIGFAFWGLTQWIKKKASESRFWHTFPRSILYCCYGGIYSL